MTGAGGSAQEKYNRLAVKHRSGRSRRLVWNLSVATVVAVIGWILGRDLYPGLIWWFIGAVLFIGFMKAVVEPNHVRAWGIGAEGERVTDRELEKLPDGHRLLHDRRIPGTRRNIDHIVVGPGGVFVIESKRMQGKLRVRGDEVFVAGRRRPMVREVLDEVAAVKAALASGGMAEIPVRPILFIQKADPPWFLGKPVGIPIEVGGRGLRRQITSASSVLDASQVDAVAGLLDARLAPMVREAARLPVEPTPVTSPATPNSLPSESVLAACPRCGKQMVLRRNRQHEAFLGCSQFPLCRGTRPWLEAAQ